MMSPCKSISIPVIAHLFLLGSLLAQEKVSSLRTDQELVESMIQVQKGDLPIILSAPHGGAGTLEGIEERKGEGLEKGASGFFTGRDSGTEELLHDVSAEIEARFGKRPYTVVSRLHRKYLDPNRPSAIAFESKRIEPFYERYHSTLAEFSREVTERFHAGILLDLHGQGSKKDTVFRGTQNGKTVSHLRQQFGEPAHQGEQSLFGLLHSRGWKVHPLPLDQKEQAGFTGGYIVKTYGSQNATPIDAMQLEFGAEYRVAKQRKKTASVLVDALVEYGELYLKIEKTERREPSGVEAAGQTNSR